jgi:CheY-like chemotaxis protein
VLTVADTGTGMTAEVQQRMFEPFFTTKPPGQGTGLGLATVYGIVRQAGGSLRVSSSAGEGTAFEISLPCATSARVESLAAKAAGPTPLAATVLLVEDDPAVRRATRRTLERSGFAVFEAEDGLQALPLLEQDPRAVDLVLSDIVMPRMGGRELAAELRRLRPDLPVLLMTGHGGADAATLRNASDDTPVIPKPFTGDDLVGHVRRALHARASS